eukprot:473821-Prymnesium_polylepis.2
MVSGAMPAAAGPERSLTAAGGGTGARVRVSLSTCTAAGSHGGGVRLVQRQQRALHRRNQRRAALDRAPLGVVQLVTVADAVPIPLELMERRGCAHDRADLGEALHRKDSTDILEPAHREADFSAPRRTRRDEPAADGHLV